MTIVPLLVLTLLLLAILAVLPTRGAAQHRFGIAQAVVLFLVILTQMISGPVTMALIPLAALCALEFAMRLTSPALGATSIPRPATMSILLVLVIVWTSLRLLSPLSFALALAIMLCGSLAILLGSTEVEKRSGLLTAMHGISVFVAIVPAVGWSGIVMALLGQAGALAVLYASVSIADIDDEASGT